MSSEVEPVNIGNPSERTVCDLVTAVEAILGRRLDVTYQPLPVDDPRVRQPDIRRAREILGWEPKVPLEQGLRQTIAFFKGRMQDGSSREPRVEERSS
jgi:nucleoside-diphosphate-sugar epimerase